jgi:hypothetical protein
MLSLFGRKNKDKDSAVSSNNDETASVFDFNELSDRELDGLVKNFLVRLFCRLCFCFTYAIVIAGRHESEGGQAEGNAGFT